MSALKEIRILDLTRGPAGGLATMILADFGAEVIHITDPEQTDDPFLKLGAAPMWQRGKQKLPLNLKTKSERETLGKLMDAADVLVISWRTRNLESQQLDYASVREKHPHLILCHISGFGNTGPLADLPGYEHAVAAASGRMLAFQGTVDRTGPVFSALQVGVHATAQSATAGILAALYRRSISGLGSLVETSMLQGMLPYEQGAMIGKQFPDQFIQLYAAAGSPEPPMPSLFYHPAQAGDGRWMQFGNLLPHLFDNFLLVTELMDVLADEDFDAKQLFLTDKEKHEAFRERMLTQVQNKSADEWMSACIENGGVVATAYQTTQEALQDPDITANGHVVQRADGVQLGPLARLSDTPAEPGPPICDGSAKASQWLEAPHSKWTKATDLASAATDLPLRGVKVVEIATIIAAPLGASFLADMGAEVIKVERIGGDPYRGLAMGVGSARVNAGKRSVSINLKSAEGRQIVQDLAANADILIHNYRPGVPARLGIDYEQLNAINPQLIYLQCNGYGPDGPGALRPSTHPIPGAAMGGVLYQMGEQVPTDLQDMQALRLWTRRLMRANEVNPDPNTALVVASACLLGLQARTHTGKGQRVLVDMFVANAYANHDDFLNYPNKPKRMLPDKGLHGLSPTYRLYPCAEDQWVFLAAVTEKEHKRLVDSLDDAEITTALLASNDHITEAALSRIFALRTADAWEATLVPEGIACLRADRSDAATFWLQNPQCDAMALTQPIEHPSWGSYRRHASNIRFGGNPLPLNPPPLAGQHNHAVLSDLGYTNADIDGFVKEGVIWSEITP